MSKNLIYLLFYLPCFLRIVHDVFWLFFMFSDRSKHLFPSNIRICAKETNFWVEQSLLCRPKLLTDGSLSPGLLVQMMVAVDVFQKAERNRLTWRSPREIWGNFLSLKVWMKWISFWKVELRLGSEQYLILICTRACNLPSFMLELNKR